MNLGDPNIYYQDHLDVAATLTDAIPAAGMDVKVVLPIFVTTRRDANGDQSWTSSAVHTTCYKSGNACPEAHSVCSPTYCSIDRWNEIIGELHDAGAKVLGLIFVSPRPHVSLQVVGLLGSPQYFELFSLATQL